MSVSLLATAEVEAFIARWGAGDGGQERANYALFLTECVSAWKIDPLRGAIGVQN
jgi:hypothetical protein